MVGCTKLLKILAKIRNKLLRIKVLPDDDHREVVQELHDHFRFFPVHNNTLLPEKFHGFPDGDFLYFFFSVHPCDISATLKIDVEIGSLDIMALRGLICRVLAIMMIPYDHRIHGFHWEEGQSMSNSNPLWVEGLCYENYILTLNVFY